MQNLADIRTDKKAIVLHSCPLHATVKILFHAGCKLDTSRRSSTCSPAVMSVLFTSYCAEEAAPPLINK